MLWLSLVLFFVAPIDDLDQEVQRHQGVWNVESFERDGVKTGEEIVRSITRVVDQHHVVWKREGKSFAGTTVKLDPSKTPHTIDVIPDGGPQRDTRMLGIYKLEGETLTICMADNGTPRPQEFKAEKGSKQTLMVFSRAKPKAAPAKP